MKKSIFKEFKEFLTRGNIVDLAVGVIIGSAFTNVTKSLVDDIFMPAIGMFLGKINFSQLKWVIIPATADYDEVAITYGNFIQAAVNFLVISLCIFFFIILIGRDPDKIKTKDEAQTEQSKQTNELLKEIRDELKNKSGKSGSKKT